MLYAFKHIRSICCDTSPFMSPLDLGTHAVHSVLNSPFLNGMGVKTCYLKSSSIFQRVLNFCRRLAAKSGAMQQAKSILRQNHIGMTEVLQCPILIERLGSSTAEDSTMDFDSGLSPGHVMIDCLTLPYRSAHH